MTEEEVRTFVEEKFKEAMNGWNAYDAAEEAIIAKWLEDKYDAIEDVRADNDY